MYAIETNSTNAIIKLKTLFTMLKQTIIVIGTTLIHEKKFELHELTGTNAFVDEVLMKLYESKLNKLFMIEFDDCVKNE